MEKKIYPLKELEIPQYVTDRDGHFREFKNWASFVTVELNNGKIFEGVLLIDCKYVVSVEGYDDLPFLPAEVVKAYQTSQDLKRRSKSSWTFWYDPNEFS